MDNKTKPDDLWTIEDIANFANTSRSTVYRTMLCRPTFPRAMKIHGGPIRYVPEEVRAWVYKL